MSNVTYEEEALDSEKDCLVTLEELLESGAHFGHQKYRWNPKMKPYIFGARNGIYIIDLAKTLQQIRYAVGVIKQMVAERKPILFVGTKKQARGVIRETAELCNEFYVSERWLGGTLTNLPTIRKSVKTLEQVEKKIGPGSSDFTKKELGLMAKYQKKLEKNLSGIRSMRKLPGMLFVVDPYHEHIAVDEANKLAIPVMALVDTNCNPDPIDWIIPCNDDSLKSIRLILNMFGKVILQEKERLKAIGGKESSLELLSSIQGEKSS